jgi:hypothetical protein
VAYKFVLYTSECQASLLENTYIVSLISELNSCDDISREAIQILWESAKFISVSPVKGRGNEAIAARMWLGWSSDESLEVALSEGSYWCLWTSVVRL